MPVLYGGETLRGSTSETVFHDVAVRGPDKRVMRRRIMHYVASKLIPLRELRLARLHSTGLRRLGVTRGELIEAEADQYADTAKWAQALHACPARPDGLIWVSRQDDSTKALVLFGDRVNRRDLEPDEEALALGFGVGFDEVCRIALESDITVVME